MHLDSIQSSWHYFMETHNCGHTKQLEEVNKIGNQGKHQTWLKGRRQYSLILLTLFGEKMQCCEVTLVVEIPTLLHLQYSKRFKFFFKLKFQNIWIPSGKRLWWYNENISLVKILPVYLCSSSKKALKGFTKKNNTITRGL